MLRCIAKVILQEGFEGTIVQMAHGFFADGTRIFMVVRGTHFCYNGFRKVILEDTLYPPLTGSERIRFRKVPSVIDNPYLFSIQDASDSNIRFGENYAMTYLLEFLHQKAPKSGKSMPAYYRKSVRVCEAILAAFMLASVILLALTNGKLDWLPVAICAGVIACYPNTDKMSANLNLLCISLAIVFWLTWFVYNFGWSAGSPNIPRILSSASWLNGTQYEPISDSTQTPGSIDL